MPKHFASRLKQSVVTPKTAIKADRGSDIGASPEMAGLNQTQRGSGNRAALNMIARSAVPAGSVQRLMTSDQLIAKAGVPQSDRFFGLKKMSAKYKEVLSELTQYDDRLNIGVEVAGERFVEGLSEQLDRLVTACTAYITAHPDDARTKHITALRDVDVVKERGVLAMISSTPALREKFAGKSLREALAIARDSKAIADAMQAATKATPSVEKQTAAKDKYNTFLGTDNPEVSDTIRDETKNASTQPFRGNDDSLTKQGKLLTQTVGQSYIKDTVIPLMASLLSEAVGKDLLKSASPLNSPKSSSPEELAKVPATTELMNQLYGRLVQGLLLNTKGGTVIPADILDAAAATFARVYETVSTDPNAKHAALHSARVSVVNLIFLRFINPVIIQIVSQLPSDTAVQFIGTRLSQIFQGQVNGIDVVKKFPEMSGSGDLIASTGAVIEQIIGQVVADGQLRAQALAAARPPSRGRAMAMIGTRR